MKTNNELKEIDFKNRTCYYFDSIIKIEDFNVLKMFQFTTFHVIIIITFPRIRFDKIDGFIRISDGTAIIQKIFETNPSLHMK